MPHVTFQYRNYITLLTWGQHKLHMKITLANRRLSGKRSVTRDAYSKNRFDTSLIQDLVKCRAAIDSRRLIRATLSGSTLAMLAAFCSVASAQDAVDVEIQNPGFESDLAGWSQFEPVLESEDANTGIGSVKIDGAGGLFSQIVSVEPDSAYSLSAFVKGFGRIGVVIDLSLIHI